MEQELLDALENKTVKRPIFLTVLCIHTWIGSALFLFFGSNKLIDQMRLLNKYTGILGFKPDKYYYWDIWNSILFLLCCLVCIVAAIAMWKLKRWGFYV